MRRKHFFYKQKKHNFDFFKNNFMRKFILILLFCTSFASFAQFEKFNVTGKFGMAGASEPSISTFSNLGLLFKVNYNEYWGSTIGWDREKFVNEIDDTKGTVSNRFTLQMVANMTNLLDENSDNYNEYFNLYMHAGFGFTAMKPLKGESGTDKIGNLVLGINPQYIVTEGFSVGIDGSLILNNSQHMAFHTGESISKGDLQVNNFQKMIYNICLTLTYSFGELR